MKRKLLIAVPFLLIALGGYALVVSPWPSMLRLALHGAHVTPVASWETVGLPLATLVTWGLAIWISLKLETKAR